MLLDQKKIIAELHNFSSNLSFPFPSPLTEPNEKIEMSFSSSSKPNKHASIRYFHTGNKNTIQGLGLVALRADDMVVERRLSGSVDDAFGVTTGCAFGSSVVVLANSVGCLSITDRQLGWFCCLISWQRLKLQRQRLKRTVTRLGCWVRWDDDGLQWTQAVVKGLSGGSSSSFLALMPLNSLSNIHPICSIHSMLRSTIWL